MANSKKVLFTATIDGHIRAFHKPYLQWFKSQGFEVHVASKGTEAFENCDYKHNVSFQRSPVSRQNWKAYKHLVEIIRNNSFDIIHCHTPTAGVLTRLAARKARKKGTKVIYTAHGFHFYKGATLKSWILFFAVEYFLSIVTDCLITINKEDYNIAKVHLKAKKTTYIHGVGVDMSKYSPVLPAEKEVLRKELGLSQEAFVLVYPAECSHRKNQKMLVEAINSLKNQIPNILLLLAGRGNFEIFNDYIDKYQLHKNITFLGFRYDIDKYIRSSDVGISASRQEGLPINVLEAMAAGKPIVATNVRGNNDLVTDEENGYLVRLNDVHGMSAKIKLLYNDKMMMERMGAKSITIAQDFSLSVALNETISIYNDMLK